MLNKHLPLLFSGILLIAPSYALADWYLGADQTNLTFSISYGEDATEDYDLTPTVLKIGRRINRDSSIEFRYYSASDGTSNDAFGNDFNVEINSIIGLYGKYFSTRKRPLGFGYNAFFGIALADTQYKIVSFQGISLPDSLQVADMENIPILAGGFGVHIELIRKLRLTADYSLQFGSAKYDSFFDDKIDVTLRGLAIGLSYTF